MASIDLSTDARQRQFIAGVSVLVGVASAIVLIGWVTDIDRLKSFALGHVAMKPNAALGFLLVSASLAAACQRSSWRLLERLSAAAVTALGAATLYQFNAQINLGIDHCLGLTDEVDAASLFPGRMAPGTAAHFLLLGLAQLCRGHARLQTLANALAGLSFFAALMPIASYLFSAGGGHGVPVYAAMAPHTAVMLTVVSLGVWASAAPHGFPKQFFATGLAGQITRVLLPMAVSLPLLIGLLVFVFRSFAAFDISFGLAIITVGNVLLFSLVCAWSARHIAESVDQRLATEQALKESHLRLKAEEEQRRNMVRQRVIEQTMLAREEEQRRIARDLHDGLGQLLTSLRFGLSSLQDAVSLKAVHERVPVLRAQLMSGQTEIRRIINDLRPTTLDELGLAPALRRLTAEFARDHNVQVDLDAVEVSQQRLSPSQETAVFRIVQESLNNIAQHAEASEVAVMVKRRGGNVELRITDNGQGVNESPADPDATSGFGLLSMQERAAQMHGVFRIGPCLPRGTAVQVMLPVTS